MNEKTLVLIVWEIWDECDCLCSDKCRQKYFKNHEIQKMEYSLTTGYDAENDKPINAGK